MEDGIQIAVLYRDTHLLKIQVSASNGSFCGVAEVYVAPSELGEIARKLTGFPSDAADIREIEVGAFDAKLAGGGAMMRFYCADLSCHSHIEVRLESETKDQSVRLVLPIEAAALDLFIDDLLRLQSPNTETVTRAILAS